MTLLYGLGAQRLAYKKRTAELAASFPNGIKCQKCLEIGHWSYECVNKRKYVCRTSRTKRLNRNIDMKLNPELAAAAAQRNETPKKKAKLEKDATSSDDDDSDSSSSSSSSSSNSSSDDSESDSSTSSDSETTSSSSNSGSSDSEEE